MSIFERFFKPWEPKSPERPVIKATPPLPPPPSSNVPVQPKEEVLPKKEESKNEKPVFLENSKNRKVLSIPWNSQRDNEFSPRSACNVTTIQMGLANHYSITDDKLFLMCNSTEMQRRIKLKYPKDYNKWIFPDFMRKNSANEVFVVLLEAIYMAMDSTKYSKIEWNLTDQKIISEIDLGYPFGACGKFIKLSNGKLGGHFVLIVGYDLTKKVWIVHDPWGNWNDNYKTHKGAYLEYSMSSVKKILYTYGFKIHADKKQIV